MRKQHIQNIIDENPKAVLVANKYKVLALLIKRMFPNNYEKISPKIWEDICFEVVNGDRDWRTLTEGKDKENKIILEQQYLINHDYLPNL